MARLDSIPKMLAPVLLTLSRGNPPVTTDYRAEQTFDNVALDAANLQSYADFCGFDRSRSPIPVSWLYLLAQRAQIALMLGKSFPLAAPGLVHISNSLLLHSLPDVAKPVALKTSVAIEGKAAGSLFPQFRVEIIQEGGVCAVCESGYIAKRGGGEKTPREQNKTNTDAAPNPLNSALTAGEIVMPSNIGWRYAKVSGDFNPIHISGVMAKAFGLPGKLAHGWYSVSMMVAALERVQNQSARRIDVRFVKPVLLPTKVALRYAEAESGAMPFWVARPSGEAVHCEGTVEF